MRISTGPFAGFLKHNNLTHKNVAEASGLSVWTIHALLQGRFSFNTLIKVCVTYRLQLSDVIEIIHDKSDDGAIEIHGALEEKLQYIFILSEVKRDDYINTHENNVTVSEIYRDAFLDCLDLCYEHLK